MGKVSDKKAYIESPSKRNKQTKKTLSYSLKQNLV